MGNAFGERSCFPIVIAEWRKNVRERVRVALDYCDGEHIVDVRVWFFNDAGELCPSKRALNFGLRHLSGLAAALNAALERAQELGLVSERSKP